MATQHLELISKAEAPGEGEDGTPHCATENGRQPLPCAVFPKGPARA